MMIGIGWLLAASLAQAAAVTAVQDVDGLTTETPCEGLPDGAIPRLVKTSAGLLSYLDDGTYAFGCPSAWGGGPTKIAANANATDVWYVAAGKVFSSPNGGCTVEPVKLPDGMAAVDLIFWRAGFWILAVPQDGSAAGELLRWDGQSFLSTVKWPSGFRPIGMLPAPGDVLWVTSIKPTSAIQRLDFTGGLSGQENVTPLPIVLTDLTAFTPTATDSDEAWFVLERQQKRWTWHAEFVDGDANDVIIFTEMDERKRVVLGPVLVDGQWLGVLDNTLYTSQQLTGQWASTGQTVPWTCLKQQGDRALACTVSTLVHITGLAEDGTPETEDVFNLAQVRAPDSACSNATCDREYDDFISGAGLVSRPDVTNCPDGTVILPPGGECGCAAAPKPSALWLGVGALLWVRRRRATGPEA